MSFVDVSNSVLLYVLVGIGLAMVALAAVYYLKKCYRHALECGVSEATMKEVVKSSITFAIVPSIAIVTGLVTLVAVIGIPYAWLRLSVIGSVAYELMASGMAMFPFALQTTPYQTSNQSNTWQNAPLQTLRCCSYHRPRYRC